MRLTRLLALMLVLLLLPAAALADKTITLTFTGDITLGGEDWAQDEWYSFGGMYRQHGPEYFLSNFAEFFAEDDLTVVNLEGVLTDNLALQKATAGKRGNYFFQGKTAYTEVLTSASVEVAALSNNHSFDYGRVGLRDTIAALNKAGIHWTNTDTNNSSDLEQFYFYEKDGVRICLLSLKWESYGQGDDSSGGAFLSQEIKRIKESGEADAVIAMFHGGMEYGNRREYPQEIFVKMAIKAGADLVICHHPHVVQGMDVINNRTVMYSLGNFCFGGNRYAYQVKPSRTQDAAPALVVRAVLTFADDGTYKGQQLTLYPVQTTSVDRNGADSQVNDYHPKFVTGPLASIVLKRIYQDMYINDNYKDSLNRDLQKLVISAQQEAAQMNTSEGRYSLTLPYLPADPAAQ